jgi:hypothetical protein
MSAVVLSPKSQVAIPADERARARLEPGRELGLIVEDGVLMLVPIRPLEELYGFLGPINYDGYREEDDEERG